MPDLYAVMERFTWTSEEMASVMYDIEDHGMKPEEAAEKWVKTHLDQIKGWIGSKA